MRLSLHVCFKDTDMRHLKALTLGHLLLVVLVALIAPLRASAQAPASTRISSGFMPRTDGTMVVWTVAQGGEPRNTDVYAANLRDRQVFPVATGPLAQGAADVDQGIVVWLESGTNTECGATCTAAIRGKNLATGQTFTVETLTGAVTMFEEGPPSISGNFVVWVSRQDRTYRLKARDIGAMAEPRVLVEFTLPLNSSVGRPAIDGNRVVWDESTFENHSNNWRLRTMQIGASTPSVIAEGGMYLPSYDVSGDLVVYYDNRQLTAVNLRTGVAKTITERQAQSPTTDGRYVFWEDRPRIGSDDPAGIRGYDLLTNGEWTVVAETGPEGYPHAYPHTRGGSLVWSRGQENQVHGVWVAEALPSARQAPPTTTSPEARYFGETGHNLSFGFKAFWDRSGGLPVFGYPLSEEFTELNRDTNKPYTVQYFERQRYEYHPENANTPYIVLLGRLGVEELQRQGRDWQSFPKAAPNAPHFFATTGHAIAPQFWDYWRTHGLEFGDRGVTEQEALALFGYPISEPQMEKNSSGDTVLTQWFERARFEYHPNNPEPYKVLLGRLAADLLATRGW
jgi:hypothetical protein